MAFEFKNFEFCDDFGDGPLLLGRITDDRSIISVVSLLGAFIAMAALGLPGAALVAFAALNDFSYAGKTETDRITGNDTTPIAIAESDPIDTTAETVAPTIDMPIVALPSDHPVDDNKMEPIALGESIEVAVDEPIEVAPSMASFASKDAIELRDIATDLGNHPQSALIFGTPGAGKGMTISNAIRTLRSKLPNLTIMMVDPKGDKKERGYWESQVDIFEARALLKTSPRSSAEWMLRCVEKFQNLDGPKLLIWDELFASITVLKGQNIPKGEDAFPCLTEFQQFISLNLSLGPSSGVWVWGMSQSANLSDLGLTSGGLSTTRIVALISPDNGGAVEGYLATKAITAPKGGMTYLDELMSQSPVSRACYDGKTKRWYPVAKLQNHSGFDRDNVDWNTVTPIDIPPNAPSPNASQSSEERKAEIARMKANIERLEALNQASHDKNVHYDIECELTDDFDPPRDRLERLWGPHPLKPTPRSI